MRAAIYARYSTDKQAETSLDDQIRVCAARSEREGWLIVAQHADNAVSGSTAVASRHGGAALLADALAGRFDILVLEGLDRLSRDQVEQESVVRRLEHRNIRIVGVADGYDSGLSARKIMRGVRGLINELYLDDLRHKTHRGQAGQVERGYVAGGKSYGYDLERDELGSRYRINEAEANWVRWIFRRYSEGSSVQALAHELNRKAVPSPRGSTWAVSALYGSPVKGSGLLNNTLYAGVYIWNRSQWVKDPDTGRRQRIERPRSEWRIVDVPHLRIVSQEVWDRVRARIDEGRDEHGRKRQHRPTRTLFGGNLICPRCGGAVIAISGTHYGCSVAKDRGPAVCQGFSVSRELLERRLISLVREDLLTDAAAQEFEQAFRLAVEQHVKSSASEQQSAQVRLDALEAEISRLVDAVAAVGISPALAAKLREAEAERAEIRQSFSPVVPQRRSAIPNIRARFERMLLDLEGALAKDRDHARVLLRDLLGVIHLRVEGEQVWADVAASGVVQVANGQPSITEESCPRNQL